MTYKKTWVWRPEATFVAVVCLFVTITLRLELLGTQWHCVIFVILCDIATQKPSAPVTLLSRYRHAHPRHVLLRRSQLRHRYVVPNLYFISVRNNVVDLGDWFLFFWVSFTAARTSQQSLTWPKKACTTKHLPAACLYIICICYFYFWGQIHVCLIHPNIFGSIRVKLHSKYSSVPRNPRTL